MTKEPKLTLQQRVTALERQGKTLREAAMTAISMANMHERLLVALIRRTELCRDEVGDLLSELLRSETPEAAADMATRIDILFDLAGRTSRH